MIRRKYLSTCLIFATLLPAHLPAQTKIHRSVPPAGTKTHTVVPGERYEAKGIRRWFLGGGYRDIWTTPVEIPVLDLDGEIGGLTVTETGGYGQTYTLEFRGADGLDYAVRSLDKDPTRRMDPLLKGTLVASIVQDQTSGFLPTAGLVVDPLLEASGLLYPKHKLVVVPDDPRLGEFREDYAGLIGMFVERPQEGPDDARGLPTPGFAGSTRVSNTERFLEALEEGECVRAETREYLKARFLDFLVGDRDRHEGQWMWARYPEGSGCYVWRPIPEDRDQAFIHNNGLMMAIYRRVDPRIVLFEEDYPGVYGLTFNGWEVDRTLLGALDQSDWIRVAEELKHDLTDAVIADAVRRLPEPHYALRGPWLERSLKERRDELTSFALDYYRMISSAAEVKGTDRDEIAVFEHHPTGNLTLTVTYRDGPRSDRPYFERTFRPSVTDEVRLYLQGGDDRVEVRGSEGKILVRAIGGGGDDTFVNESEASKGRVRFYDDRGDNEYEGPANIDESSFELPPPTNLIHRHGLDWGGLNRTLPFASYSPDVGAKLGFVFSADRYGFRKVPWQSRHTVQGVLTTVGPEALVTWDSRFREALGFADALLHLEYSGINILRFHGYGNGTQIGEDTDFFKVEQREIVIAPGVEWTFSYETKEEEEAVSLFRPKMRLGVGPILKRSDTPADDNADKFIGTLDPAPLGIGTYGQVGGRGWIDIDTRDNAAYPTSGFQLLASASLYPAAWDVEEAFGHVQGSVSGFLTPGSSEKIPTLAFRVGGKKVFGTYPFHEAAYLGGDDNVRGLREERFAGDAAVFGNAELRLPLSQFSLLFPTEFGLHGAADFGRVFFDSDPDDADDWHTAFGGGIWISLLDRIQTLSISVMSGEDLTALYLKAGLHF
ncbi:MAG: BamA/TamA family outer membrane protein [Gemmatimonadota bacterium]